MTAYADIDTLQSWAQFYDVELPSTDDCERLLDLATRDVQTFLGARWVVADLEPEQVTALRDATAVQATFRVAQGGEFTLGVDDGLASIGGVSFSTRTPARLSPEAEELLAGMALYVRSGTVALDVEA